MYPEIKFILVFPILGFLFNGVFGSKLKNERISGAIGVGALFLSFSVAVMTLFRMLSVEPYLRSQTVSLFEWFSTGTGTAGSLKIPFEFLVDQLSIVMVLIVTGVGFLIHVYSLGYMRGDRGFARFFAYLNLFITAMLILVLASNYVLLFLGWEGVGLCSYLLIGFWYDRKFEKSTTSDAAKKAFIVNRIGDFGFLLGMFLIFTTFGSLDFRSVFNQAVVFETGDPRIVAITLLLFLGATGKSAQIPLYVWLPDAMAGPTPVSALIHAATMVTAGVYMVSRTSILFALAPQSMLVVAAIGGVTALFAATVGLVQNDIKKVLAYSTISQLGYMFLAAGVGAFSASIFHVMTHAFFKALLFLGAGAVIHAMHEEQNIQNMGGLKKYLPWTQRTFLVGTLAIAGIPPLAGFFSKDEILAKAFGGGSIVLWGLGFLAAGLTAFYMSRLYLLTFEGKSRFGSDRHPHEAPRVMTIPLMILALLSIVGGWIGIPAALGGSNPFEHWLDPVFEPAMMKMSAGATELSAYSEYLLMALTMGLVLSAMWLAYRWYIQNPEAADRLKTRFSKLYSILWNKYYVDEGYDFGIVRPVFSMSSAFLWKIVDVKLIDGAVNGLAKLMEVTGRGIRRIQTGVVQMYAILFLIGVLISIWLLVIA